MRIYHVFNRGNRKGKICFDIEDVHVLKKMFLDSFVLAKRVSFISLCIMPNHYHLLIAVVKKRHLSIRMRDISRDYTTYMNKKYGLVGRLFQGPYQKKVVNNFIYFRTLVRYMKENPKALSHNKHLTKIITNEDHIKYYDFFLTTKSLP